MNIKNIFKNKIFWASLFLWPLLVFSEGSEYDCYVEGDYFYGNVDSQSRHYKKISQAIKNDCANIFVANGVYDEDVSLGDNVQLTGENREKTVIKGNVRMSGVSRISDVSVILEKKSSDVWYENQWTEEASGIWTGGGSDVIIKNVIVMGAGMGIETEGEGEIVLENAKIINNAKGVYIRKNRSIEIINSNISNNSEEGIDVRDRVEGNILSNIVENNQLSGIEIVIGYDKLNISNNRINDNGNSGISLQYYSDADSIGNLQINENIISGNQKYGFDCKRPMGGSPGGSYWSDSIDEMNTNVMQDNVKGNFASACKFSDNIKFKALQVVSIDDEIEKEHYRFFDEEIERQIIQTAIQNRSKLKTFLMGTDYDRLNELEQKIENYTKHINKLDNYLQKTEKAETIDMINKDKEEIKKLNKEIEEFIEKERNKFSLLGWFFD